MSSVGNVNEILTDTDDSEDVIVNGVEDVSDLADPEVTIISVISFIDDGFENVYSVDDADATKSSQTLDTKPVQPHGEPKKRRKRSRLYSRKTSRKCKLTGLTSGHIRDENFREGIPHLKKKTTVTPKNISVENKPDDFVKIKDKKNSVAVETSSLRLRSGVNYISDPSSKRHASDKWKQRWCVTDENNKESNSTLFKKGRSTCLFFNQQGCKQRHKSRSRKMNQQRFDTQSLQKTFTEESLNISRVLRRQCTKFVDERQGSKILRSRSSYMLKKDGERNELKEDDVKTPHSGMFYVCASSCGYSTLLEQEYKSHVDECQFSGSLSCVHCFYSAADPSDLLHHMNKHCYQTASLYQCVCHFATNNQSVLFEHLWYECNDVGYHCMKCDTWFVALGDLKQHFNKNLMLVVWCKFCSAVCCDMHVMFKHLEQHQGSQYWTMHELLCLQRQENKHSTFHVQKQRCCLEEKGSKDSFGVKKMSGDEEKCPQVHFRYMKPPAEQSDDQDIVSGIEPSMCIEKASQGQKKSSSSEEEAPTSSGWKTFLMGGKKKFSLDCQEISVSSCQETSSPGVQEISPSVCQEILNLHGLGKSSTDDQKPLSSDVQETSQLGGQGTMSSNDQETSPSEPPLHGKEISYSSSNKPLSLSSQTVSLLDDQKSAFFVNYRTPSSVHHITPPAGFRQVSSAVLPSVVQEPLSSGDKKPSHLGASCTKSDSQGIESSVGPGPLSREQGVVSSSDQETSQFSNQYPPIQCCEETLSVDQKITALKGQGSSSTDCPKRGSFNIPLMRVTNTLKQDQQNAGDQVFLSDDGPKLYVECSEETDDNAFCLKLSGKLGESSNISKQRKSSENGLGHSDLLFVKCFSTERKSCLKKKLFEDAKFSSTKYVTIPSENFYNKAVKCYTCNFSSMVRKNLERHIKSCHAGVKVILEPTQSFSGQETSENNEAVVENEPEFLDEDMVWLYENHGLFFVCSICKKVISKQYVLDCHLLDHLQISLGVCPVCDDEWCFVKDHYEKTNWKSPLEVEAEIKEVVSTVLGDVRQGGDVVTDLQPCLGTAELNNQLSHFIQRVEGRPHCGVCSAYYYDDYSMHRHILVKHLNISLFTCGVCGFGGTERFDVARHVHMNHSQEPLSLNYHSVDSSSVALFGGSASGFTKQS